MASCIDVMTKQMHDFLSPLLYKDTESDFWWKIKHYAKQWLWPFL